MIYIKKNKSGVTLVELIVALSIFVVASVVIWSFITNSYKIQNFTFEQSSAITEARRGVETMVKELRETLPGDNGSYPIESANPQELIFYSDFDRDNAIEKVHYWLDGSEFKKGVIEASGTPLTYDPLDEEIQVISQYVRNNTTTVFTYRDSDYTELATPADPNSIKLVNVFLNINVYEDRTPFNYELESDVTLRNLKENL
ncbi:MAG: type II secretion system protein [Patescibacteria group bacterium]